MLALACGLVFLALLPALFMCIRRREGRGALISMVTMVLTLLATLLTLIIFIVDCVLVSVVHGKIKDATDGVLTVQWGDAVRASPSYFKPKPFSLTLLLFSFYHPASKGVDGSRSSHRSSTSSLWSLRRYVRLLWLSPNSFRFLQVSSHLPSYRPLRRIRIHIHILMPYLLPSSTYWSGSSLLFLSLPSTLRNIIASAVAQTGRNRSLLVLVLSKSKRRHEPEPGTGHTDPSNGGHRVG